nr:thioredoxin family protein [Rickettsiaceae bacterium]
DLFSPKIVNYVYEGGVESPLVLNAKNNREPINLKAEISYVVCGDQCVPVSQVIERQIPAIQKNPIHNGLSVDKMFYDSGVLSFNAYFSEDPDEEILKFIILCENKVIGDSALVQKYDGGYLVIFQMEEEKYAKLIGKGAKIYSNISPLPCDVKLPQDQSASTAQMPLYFILIMALVGGFVLNFMPCVLPVLALKFMSISKAGKDYRRSLLITVVGMVSTFWALSVASVTMKDIGIGMGFQQSEFLIILSLFMVFFISIAMGRVNISIPLFITEMAAMRFASKYLEDFLAGVIATMLSIPCTAPFLGAAMATAFVSEWYVNFLIFTFTAIGFSLPYLLVIISPRFIGFIPKSGKWMELFKKAMAILLIASLVWVINILYSALGIRATFGFVLILAFAKYVIEEDSKIFAKSFIKIPAIIVIAVGALYLPQMAHQEDLARDKYISGVWQEFDESKISEYVNDGKVVVVDITADWCITCKVNKIRLWNRGRVVNILSSPSVVAMRADVTKINEKVEQFLLKQGVFGVPFSAVYGPRKSSGIILPVLVGYEDLKSAIEEAR